MEKHGPETTLDYDGSRLAILGDIADQPAASNAFRDFVYEANLGTQFWFVSDLADLEYPLESAS